MMLSKWADQYVTFMLGQLEHDLGVYNHWWMWVPLLIPVIFYSMFVVIKFGILLAPIWFSAKILIGIINSTFAVIIAQTHKPSTHRYEYYNMETGMIYAVGNDFEKLLKKAHEYQKDHPEAGVSIRFKKKT